MDLNLYHKSSGSKTSTRVPQHKGQPTIPSHCSSLEWYLNGHLPLPLEPFIKAAIAIIVDAMYYAKPKNFIL